MAKNWKAIQMSINGKAKNMWYNSIKLTILTHINSAVPSRTAGLKEPLASPRQGDRDGAKRGWGGEEVGCREERRWGAERRDNPPDSPSGPSLLQTPLTHYGSSTTSLLYVKSSLSISYSLGIKFNFLNLTQQAHHGSSLVVLLPPKMILQAPCALNSCNPNY